MCVYSVDDYNSLQKPLPSPATIPFGISCIATALHEAGHNVKIQVFTPDTNLEKAVHAVIKDHKPGIFCLTAVSTQYPLIRRVARIVKTINSSIQVILGGHHSSLNPDEVIQNTDFDAICIGEGEKGIVEVARSIMEGKTPTGIKNFWFKNKETGNIEKNPTNDFLQDLDSLPFINRALWDEWIADTSRLPTVLVGRGCPYRCTYCSNHVLSKISHGKYVRFRSPENVIKEIQEITRHYPKVSTVFLEIETLTSDLTYTKKLCAELEKLNSTRTEPLTFGTNITFIKSLLQSDELLRTFKEADFTFLNIGLESGSERVRNEILRRPPYANSDIIAFCDAARRFNLKINLFALIGIPGEKLADFRETVACVRSCDPESVMLSIFYPYPGTDLYRIAKNQGLLKQDNHVSHKATTGPIPTMGCMPPKSHGWRMSLGAMVLRLKNEPKNHVPATDGTFLKGEPIAERWVATLNLPGFSKRQISREFLLFYYHVYYARKSLIKVLAVTIRTFIGMHPRLNTLYRSLLNVNFFKVLWKKLSGSM